MKELNSNIHWSAYPSSLLDFKWVIIRSWKGTHSWEGRRVSCTRNVFQTETGEQTTLKARVVRMVRGDGGLMKVGSCSFRRH